MIQGGGLSSLSAVPADYLFNCGGVAVASSACFGWSSKIFIPIPNPSHHWERATKKKKKVKEGEKHAVYRSIARA